MKYFCVTEAVALYIQKYVQYRKRKIFFGATGKIEDLVPSIVKHKTEKYLVPMSDVHNDDVKNLLDKNHIQHTEAVMISHREQRLHTSDEEFDYDMLVFFSPAGSDFFEEKTSRTLIRKRSESVPSDRLPRKLYATPDSVWTLKHQQCKLPQ